MTTVNFMGLSLYQQMIYYTHMMLMTRNKYGYKDIFKSGILSHLSNTLNSEHFAERDAKAIFFLSFIINNYVPISTTKTQQTVKSI